ncbi:hypothetical protein GQ457_04G008100 [Hibiscus cannabinus]
MAATPPPLAHLGDDVSGWRWDKKREFQVGSTYVVLMKEKMWNQLLVRKCADVHDVDNVNVRTGLILRGLADI